MAASPSRRGAALVLVLGVLAVLSLLGLTFSRLSTLDRRVARGYLDDVRAGLAARAGVERAVAEIAARTGQNVFAPPQPEDIVEIVVDGGRIPATGIVGGGTYAPNGDVVRVRAVDANALIHLNDGAAEGNGSCTSRNLARILDVLGQITGVAGAGTRIVSARPAGGYRSKAELQNILGGDYARIAPFVTAAAWVDAGVVNPVPLSAETLAACPVPYNAEIGIYRYGRSFSADGAPVKAPLLFAPDFADPRGSDHAVMALDEINAQWIERAARAPVNVNEAPREVLTALIAGLRGWFVAGRRKTNPAKGMYSFMFPVAQDGRPGGVLGDEYGYLYATEAFAAPGSEEPGVPALSVADEIIACRLGLPSPHCPAIDYGAVPWGGPFRTWRQFHAFCDGLVTGGLLADRRAIYHDFRPEDQAAEDGWTAVGLGKQPAHGGPDALVEAKLQPHHAAQALADVLKANFNPNCSLNELNPDANLHLLVDKTDLLCNSTEFCLTPMGRYDIESEGLVLETTGGRDLLETREGRCVARRTVACSVKVFDVRRETAQSDFVRGLPGLRSPQDPVTNNNRTMEIGPEPDNGPAPLECRWGGYLQLPTLGGPWKDPAEAHVAGETTATPAPPREPPPETLLAHFRYDAAADVHAGKAPEPLLKNFQCRNNPDRTEPEPGPYGPTRGAPGRHRLAHDWSRRDLRGTPEPVAPGDLRLDGAYIERDSCVMWENSPAVFGSVGTVAFWVKPSFHPEMTGKPRAFFTMDTLSPSTIAWSHQRSNGVWFFASHDVVPSGTARGKLPGITYSAGPWSPASLCAGFSAGYGGVGISTASLNRRGVGDPERRALLGHHRWTHVTYGWDMNVRADGPKERKAFLWINGEEPPGRDEIWIHPGPMPAGEFLGNGNPIRLGEASKTWVEEESPFGCAILQGSHFTRNWSADATIDEFHMWAGNALGKAQDLYALGRYRVPRPGAEAVFTSGPIRPAPERRETLPPAAGGGRSAPPPTPPATARLLGAAWTLLPDATDPSGAPAAVDPEREGLLAVETELALFSDGGSRELRLRDDGGSPCDMMVLDPGRTLRYRLTIRIPAATVDTILLATPVIDDVTIYYSTGIEYLSYEARDSAP